MFGQARAPSPKGRSPSSLADPRPFARRAPRRRTAPTGAEELWRRRPATTTRAFHDPLVRARARCLVSARPSNQSAPLNRDPAPTAWLTYAEAAAYTDDSGWRSDLDGDRGYLVADAHIVYDHLYRGGQVIEVGCWAHYLEQYVIHSVPDLKYLEAG